MKKVSIKIKLIAGFLSLAIITGIIGSFAIKEMKTIEADDTAMYKTVVVPLDYCTQLAGWIQRMRTNAAEMLIFAGTPIECKKKHDRFLLFSTKSDSILAAYATTIIDSIDKKNYQALITAKKEYVEFFPEFTALIESGKIEEARNYMSGEWYKASNNLQTVTEVLIDYNVISGKEISVNNTKIANAATNTMLVFIGIGVLVALLLGLFIATNIQKIIQSVVGQIRKLSQAAVEGKLSTRGEPEKINFEFREIMVGINDTLDAVIGPLNVAAEYVDRISKGDIPAKITDTYNGDFSEIKNTLNTCIDTLNTLLSEHKEMSRQHNLGMIDEVMAVNKFQGAYATMASEINQLVQSHIAVKMRVVDVVSSYAKGDLSVDMDRLPGKKAKITEAIDNVKRNMLALNNEIMTLVEAAKAGKLATRGDASKYEYSFKDMVDGVNATLDAVVGPLNVAANYVENISKGQIPTKITDSYNGDFNVIKNNLNQCIDAVNLLVSDANMLAVAAVDGRLATRADASKHQGDFKAIVDGVNKTLDAVIEPLNVAASYVKRISIGDMPPIITENYNGDFNEIKNNLNLTIETLNSITENAKLVAIGDLDVELNKRCDKDGLMIALIQMVKAMRDISEKTKTIASGDMTVEIKPRSDKDEMILALADMIKSISDIVTQVQVSSDNIADASQQMSSNSQQVSQGASEQASAAEEVSSSMEEMASNIQQNTENAQQTEKIAAKAAEDILIGSKNVNTTVESMKKIAEKVSIIGDIAFQTNILALNAAVEAARAGEHGKGFAVVAAEVRKLAERSHIAAGEINELTKSSVEIADQSGKLLASIVPDIQKTAKLVQEITAASIEQNSGANQINNAINQLNKVTQQNAASAEEMATSSEELSSQADNLKDLIGFFKVNDNGISKHKTTYTTKHAVISKSNKPQHKSLVSKGGGIDLNMDQHDGDYERF
jgi:methyl-accepting chemotaxis protein